MFSTELTKGVGALKSDLSPYLLKAAQKGNLNFVKTIVHNGANVNCEDDDGQRPIFFAADKNYAEIVLFLLKCGAEINYDNLLGWACENGHVEITKYLLEEKHANPNGPSVNGKTPLFLAYYKHEFFKYNHEIVKLLIKNGANCTITIAKTGLKFHLIEFATSYGDLELVKYLIDNKKLNIDARYYGGKTLLHIAAESLYSVDDLEKVVKFLLSRNADTEINDSKRKTPYDISKETEAKNEDKIKITKLLKKNVSPRH